MKKASLSLSIESIVILILAIVVMAFTIPFITDLFEKTKGGIIGQFPEVQIYATTQDPIGIGNEFYIKPGEEKKMTLQVYNNRNNAVTIGTGAIQITSCYPGAKPEVSAVEQGLPALAAGEATKVKLVITGKTGMENNAICKIEVGTGAEPIKQSFFLVTK